MMNHSLIELLETRRLLSTTYYVSNGGDDAHTGTSPTTAWRTIAMVNSISLQPGDRVLFQSGQSFGGSLKPKTGGTPASPIQFSTFGGTVRAVINSGKSDGALVYNLEGLWFEYLTFTGAPNGASHDGVRFEINGGGTRTNIGVDSCVITGYGSTGVHIIADQSKDRFVNVWIAGNSIHDCVDAGINTTAPVRNAHVSFYIARNDIYHINGDPHKGVTGSGIVLGDVDGATVELNTIHQNGEKYGNGGAAVWTTGSNRIVLQHNEGYQNRAPRGADGDGFDFDADTMNSIMQFNYSHDNDGAGLMFDQWKSNSLFTGNVIRYNVSQNNAIRNSRYAGISVFGHVANSLIYNNDVYQSSGSSSTAGVRILYSALGGSFVNGLRVANNIIVTTGGRALIDVESRELNHGSNLTFAGNDYWSSGAAVKFSFGGTYSSLASWQAATGQEKLDGKSVGIFADPKLSAAGKGGNLGAQQLATLSAYLLQGSSPLINHGIDVDSIFGGPAITTDFYGDHAPQGSGYEIGADEVVES
jgi:hypothetical protein